MKRIGIVLNTRKAGSEDVLARLVAKARSRGLELVCTDEVSASLPDATAVREEDLSGQVEVMMALGGDGTMLRTIRAMPKLDIPVIGVNLGSLGFLTSVAEKDLEAAVDALADESFQESPRTVMDVEIQRPDAEPVRYRALNDAVVGWGTSSRMITLGVEINEQPVSAYSCDGLIISTPTGSTGHSLSASGSVIYPEAQVLHVNVICPHTLSARPLIVPDSVSIGISADELDEQKNLILSIDGQIEETFKRGDKFVVKKHPRKLRLLNLPGYSYFAVLREKLHWRGSYKH